MGSHLHYFHGITGDEYKLQFPGEELASDEVKKLLSDSRLDYFYGEEGEKHRQEYSNRRSKQTYDWYNGPDGDRHRQESSELASKINEERWNGPKGKENRERASEIQSSIMNERFSGPDGDKYRKEKSDQQIYYFHGPEGEKHRKEYSERTSKQMIEFYHGKNGEENRKKNSDRFKDPDFVSRVFANKGPNKVETYLLEYLEEKFPGQWLFTGNRGDSGIEGRFPDFTSTIEKKVIELFGIYFHSLDPDSPHSEEGTIRHYETQGYKCLVIWADNWEDIVLDLHLISRFCKVGESE